MTSSKCVCLCVCAVVWKQIHKEDEREEMHKRQFWKDNVESRPVRDISGIPQLHVEEGFSLRETADAAKSHQDHGDELAQCQQQEEEDIKARIRDIGRHGYCLN